MNPPPDGPDNNYNPWGDPPDKPNPQQEMNLQNVNQQYGFNEQQPQFFKGQMPNQYAGNETLPNSVLILTFGILGIVMGCGLIGLILNIVNLVLASAARKEIAAYPGRYSAKSCQQMKAGYTCSIIGLILLPLSIIAFVIAGVSGAFD